MELANSAKDLIQQAAHCLRVGEIVVFPTETVYGLGASLAHPQAISKIFAAKSRPLSHPLIAHVGHLDQFHDLAHNIPQGALTLMHHFSPGPLTLVLPKHPDVSDLACAQQPTIAIRMPAHPIALSLIQQLGTAIVAPSANQYGRTSPTRVEHICPKIHQHTALILDGGPCRVGIESTIIDYTTPYPRILRHGTLSLATLQAHCPDQIIETQSTSIRHSGQDKVHYAPQTPLFILDTEALHKHLQEMPANLTVGVIAFCSLNTNQAQPSVVYIQAERNPENYAHHLYHRLQTLDALALDQILLETPPMEANWHGVQDRIKRAAHRWKCTDR